MPIPKPKKNEKKKTFKKRCMSNKHMVKEYDNDQRYAICMSKWKEKHEGLDNDGVSFGHLVSNLLEEEETW